MMVTEMASKEKVGQKFYVNIEGAEYPWDKDTITAQDIRSLGGIPADVPILQEAPDGTERTIGENEAIALQPGHRLGRAAKYRRG
jgi:hypothetical protein